ncbi:HAD family hydrolase [Planctomonas deserti]|uniref:HAD family hydrolase n=1 Tax=Planctomonas deserti TaxID=2144185 RepID=UPI000D389469|nr:HAD family hydrolase [Planctomonas deserti]
MAGVSAVAFDLDGTLLDHRAASASAFTQLVRELGGTATPGLQQAWWDAEDRHFEAWRQGRISFDEQRRRRLREVLPLVESASASGGGLGDRGLHDGVLGGREMSDERLDRIFDVYRAAYESAWCVFPEVVAVLDAVRSAGMSVGLLTNGSERQQEEKLARTGIRDRFDVVCTSESVGLAKPDPGAFAALCSRLGVPPADVLFVGDDYRADILGARAAGLRTYFVDRSGARRGDDGERDGASHPDLLGILPLLA